MDSSPQLLLNVWREVSRHTLIDESVTRVMPLLSPELPLDALLVRHVDLARTTLETVAAAMVRPGQAPGGAKTEYTPEDLDRMLAWCREGPLLRAGDRPIQKQLPKRKGDSHQIWRIQEKAKETATSNRGKPTIVSSAFHGAESSLPAPIAWPCP
jgi:hypothetical protein